MQFEVMGIDYDNRIDSYMVTARADYEWYLSKTQGSEENLEIQRDIIKGSKPYKNLRADLELGCILPTIVLAVNEIDASAAQKYDPGDGFMRASQDDLLALEPLPFELSRPR